MIKIGVYASMFGKDQPPRLDSVESYIEHASRLKLDMIDFLAGRGFRSRDPAYLLGVKRQCLQAGLPIGYLASGGHFVGTDEELRRKLQQVRADVEMAAFLGAPMIRLFCGRPLEDAEARRREVRSFQEAAEYAAEHGILVGLQNHPSTGDDVLRILRETDRENFVFLLDTGQWVGSPALNRGQGDPHGDTYRYMEQTAPHAVHVRAKFYKIDSGREEWLDYPRILRILQSAGFNGCVSVVFEGKDANQCDDHEVIRLAAAHLRELLAGG
jgi:sugar phosphate isomerase/epimerase